MHWFKLSIKNLSHRPLYSLIGILLLAFGISIMLLLFNLQDQMQARADKQNVGIEMVVGAKGSPLQLILANLFHIDNPTGNISYAEYQKLVKNPLIKKHFPLSYGDNYLGYKILGTNKSYLELYNTEIEEGRIWERSMEVILGYEIADRHGLKLGDKFESSHGMDAEGETHDHAPFEVVGILKKNATILDRLIITDLHSIWEVHDHHQHEDTNHTNEENETSENHDHEKDHDHEHDHSQDQITAGLLIFNSPLGSVTLPRYINENTNMQAALPGIEMERLFSLLGIGIDTLRVLAYIIIGLSFISIFIAMFQMSHVLRYEMALLRAIGSPPLSLSILLMMQAIWICLIGFVVGWAIEKFLFYLLIIKSEATWASYFSLEWINGKEPILLAIVLLLGIFAAAIPAIRIFKQNISGILSEGK